MLIKSMQVAIVGNWSLISLAKLREEFRTHFTVIHPREEGAGVFTH